MKNTCFFESEELGSNCGREDMGAVIPVSMWWMMPCSGLRVAAIGHNSVGNSLEFLEQILNLGWKDCGSGLCMEPILLNVYGAPELIPRNEFHQPM